MTTSTAAGIISPQPRRGLRTSLAGTPRNRTRRARRAEGRRLRRASLREAPRDRLRFCGGGRSTRIFPLARHPEGSQTPAGGTEFADRGEDPSSPACGLRPRARRHLTGRKKVHRSSSDPSMEIMDLIDQDHDVKPVTISREGEAFEFVGGRCGLHGEGLSQNHPVAPAVAVARRRRSGLGCGTAR